MCVIQALHETPEQRHELIAPKNFLKPIPSTDARRGDRNRDLVSGIDDGVDLEVPGLATPEVDPGVDLLVDGKARGAPGAATPTGAVVDRERVGEGDEAERGGRVGSGALEVSPSPACTSVVDRSTRSGELRPAPARGCDASSGLPVPGPWSGQLHVDLCGVSNNSPVGVDQSPAGVCVTCDL